MKCVNFDHNKFFGLFKFQSGYSKFNLNSPKGYSWKIINAQTELGQPKRGQYRDDLLKLLNI